MKNPTKNYRKCLGTAFIFLTNGEPEIPEHEKNVSRRDFIKPTGAVTVGAALTGFAPLTSARAKSDPNDAKRKTVPKRPFGRTGVRKGCDKG